MQLSQRAIDEFRQIYKKGFGKEIDSAKANALGVSFLRLMKIIYRPIPTSEGSTARSGNLARDGRRPTEATDIPIKNH